MNSKASYKIEFIGSPTIQEKLVFSNLPDYVYFNMIDQVFDFIKKCKKIVFKDYTKNQINKSLNDLYISKTKKRILEFSKQSNFDIKNKIIINKKEYPSLNIFTNKVLNVLEQYLNSKNRNKLTMMHGDLCASNILIDNRSKLIKLIDPRGGMDTFFNSKNNIIGDYRYDIAKLVIL